MEVLYKTTLSRLPVDEVGNSESHAGGLHLPPGIEAGLRYEPFQILERVDPAKRYHQVLDSSFPLAVGLYDYPTGPGIMPMTWHERLEIFCPLAGSGAFRIGEHLEPFEAADILVIDNLRLHGVDRFEGPRRHALLVVFYPELVAPPGALPCDLWLLSPFRHLRDGCLHLRRRDTHAPEAWDCLSRLLLAQVEGVGDPACQARQKTVLVELLIVLEEAFRDRIVEHSDYERRRDRLRCLSPLLEFLNTHHDEALSVPAAAQMLGMSASYFMRFFRNATGLTFSAYVGQLRVSRAYRLLLEGDLSLAQIASDTGFCDQCHMSRHIRRRFGTSPGRIRSEQRALATKRTEVRPG
jgi:AraC-like DNA-binding protein